MADLCVDVGALTELAGQPEALKAALAGAAGNVDAYDDARRSRAAAREGA